MNKFKVVLKATMPVREGCAVNLREAALIYRILAESGLSAVKMAKAAACKRQAFAIECLEVTLVSRDYYYGPASIVAGLVTYAGKVAPTSYGLYKYTFGVTHANGDREVYTVIAHARNEARAMLCAEIAHKGRAEPTAMKCVYKEAYRGDRALGHVESAAGPYAAVGKEAATASLQVFIFEHKRPGRGATCVSVAEKTEGDARKAFYDWCGKRGCLDLVAADCVARYTYVDRGYHRTAGHVQYMYSTKGASAEDLRRKWLENKSFAALLGIDPAEHSAPTPTPTPEVSALKEFTFDYKAPNGATAIFCVVETAVQAAAQTLSAWLRAEFFDRPLGSAECVESRPYTGPRKVGSVVMFPATPVQDAGKAGVDVHALRAQKEGISRQEAKRRNYSDIYSTRCAPGTATGRTVHTGDYSAIEASVAVYMHGASETGRGVDARFPAQQDPAHHEKHRPAQWTDGHGWVNLYVNKNGVVQAGGIYTSAQKAREISNNKKAAPTLIAWDVSTHPGKPAKTAERHNTEPPKAVQLEPLPTRAQLAAQRQLRAETGRGGWYYAGYEHPNHFLQLSTKELAMIKRRIVGLPALISIAADFRPCVTPGKSATGNVRISFSSGRYAALTDAFRNLLSRRGVLWSAPSVGRTECSLEELLKKCLGSLG